MIIIFIIMKMLLLESYFDDFDVESEEEVIAINNQVADTDGIESYGWIDELWFEK